MVKVIFQLVIFRQTVEIGILHSKDVVDGRTANGTHVELAESKSLDAAFSF